MPKSVTRTVRVDEELDKAVAKRAADEGVSVNFIVGRALRKMTDWDMPGVKLGFVTTSSALLSLLGEGYGEDEMKAQGRRIARDFMKPATEYMFGKFSLDSSIELLRRSSIYGGRMSFDFVEGSDSRKSVLLIKHGQGRKWSSYYSGMLEETFNVLLGYPGRSTQTDSLCIMQLDSRPSHPAPSR